METLALWQALVCSRLRHVLFSLRSPPIRPFVSIPTLVTSNRMPSKKPSASRSVASTKTREMPKSPSSPLNSSVPILPSFSGLENRSLDDLSKLAVATPSRPWHLGRRYKITDVHQAITFSRDLYFMGQKASRAGNHQKGEAMYTRAFWVACEIPLGGWKFWSVNLLYRLAAEQALQRKIASAKVTMDRAVSLLEDVGPSYVVGLGRETVAQLCESMGDPGAARESRTSGATWEGGVRTWR